MNEETLKRFIDRHRLPASFVFDARDHFLPLARQLPAWRHGARTLLLGINGAQGTGKSTLADFLADATRALFGWSAAVLSIDDFYRTKAERVALARNVHPLLATRGVPGTHDLGLLDGTLDRLLSLGDGERVALPRFSKADDDRADPASWPEVLGPVDLIVLEGWCVGSLPAEASESSLPINALERDEDPDGRWRAWVEARLRSDYAPVFARLDALVFLEAPSFDAVHRWRLEQEEKLAETGTGAGILSAPGVARFIQYFERISRRNLKTLPSRASAVLRLDEAHRVIETRFRGDANSA